MFIDALRIFSWKGRICRWQYIVALLFTLFIVVTFLVLIGVKIDSSTGTWTFICIRNIAWMPSHIKRLHDIGRDGKWAIPLIIFPIFNLILIAIQGSRRINKYGLNPEREHVLAKPTANKWENLGNSLAYLLILTTEENNLLESLQEKFEMRYFLLNEINRLLIKRYADCLTENNINTVMNTMIEEVSLASGIDENIQKKFQNEYNNRLSIYEVCCEEEGSNRKKVFVGTRAFALSHFLQKARGKTTGRDVMDVITQKRELRPEDLSEFLDICESQLLVIGILGDLHTIRTIIRQVAQI